MGDTSEEDLEQEASDEALMLIKYAAKEFLNSDTNDNAIETEEDDVNTNKKSAVSLLLDNRETESKEKLEAEDKEVEEIFKDQEAVRKVSGGQVGTKRKVTLDHWEVAKEAEAKRRPIQSHWRQISTGEWVEVGAHLTGYKLRKEGGFCRLKEGHHFLTNREAMLSYCRSDQTNTALHCTAVSLALLHLSRAALQPSLQGGCTDEEREEAAGDAQHPPGPGDQGQGERRQDSFITTSSIAAPGGGEQEPPDPPLLLLLVVPLEWGQVGN